MEFGEELESWDVGIGDREEGDVLRGETMEGINVLKVSKVWL